MGHHLFQPIDHLPPKRFGLGAEESNSTCYNVGKNEFASQLNGKKLGNPRGSHVEKTGNLIWLTISLFAGLLISGAALAADGPKTRKKPTMFKKIILTIGLIIVLAVVGLVIYIYESGPPLPPNSDEIISQVMRSELPEIFRGKTGYAKSGDINIWYESIEPDGAKKGAVLLLAGISSDAVAWPPKFLDALAAAGYQVIRTDHRGTGMSDWIEDWGSDNPYSLEDMANDGIAVLDALGIEEAHVIGVSMGGMIAQQMSIDHPDRVLSLTSIMSSGNIADPNLPPISMDIAQELVKASLKYGSIKSERNTIKLHIASRMILMGDASYAIDVKTIAEQVLYNLRKRKGYNSQASIQQQAAVTASGSRYEKLQALDTPALIIHGRADPFIPIEHGLKSAALIPNADTLWIEGMAHDLPDAYVDVVVEKIIMSFQRAE